MADHGDIANVVAAIAAAGTKPRRGKEAIPTAKRAGPPIGASRGTGLGSNPQGDSAGGIASPLTETAYADREYHAEETLTSSDGLFTAQVQRVRKMYFRDANDAAAAIVLKAPAA